MKKLTKANFPRSFGVFSPTGHIVMALTNDAAAKQAQQALILANQGGRISRGSYS